MVNARLERCRALMPVLGVMQTVQRAEFLGAVVAMQAYWPCHVGIDNLRLLGVSVVCLIVIAWLNLSLQFKMVI